MVGEPSKLSDIKRLRGPSSHLLGHDPVKSRDERTMWPQWGEIGKPVNVVELQERKGRHFEQRTQNTGDQDAEAIKRIVLHMELEPVRLFRLRTHVYTCSGVI